MEHDYPNKVFEAFFVVITVIFDILVKIKQIKKKIMDLTSPVLKYNAIPIVEIHHHYLNNLQNSLNEYNLLIELIVKILSMSWGCHLEKKQYFKDGDYRYINFNYFCIWLH